MKTLYYNHPPIHPSSLSLMHTISELNPPVFQKEMRTVGTDSLYPPGLFPNCPNIDCVAGLNNLESPWLKGGGGEEEKVPKRVQ